MPPTALTVAGALADPAAAHHWTIPERMARRIDADVFERWVANVVIGRSWFPELVPADFLKPELIDGQLVLSLCMIFMRHAAPDWAPLTLGPGSHNAALRIACIDRRDGSPAVWVDERHTDSRLGPLLEQLGFPALRNDLSIDRSPDFPDTGHFHLAVEDGAFDLHLGTGRTTGSAVFANTPQFERYFTAGIRSYGPGPDDDHIAVVDLEKRSDNHFVALPQLGGCLALTEGAFPVDSVYRTIDGRYRWILQGWVDHDGKPVDAPPRRPGKTTLPMLR